jgi:phospholipase A1/A2
MQLSEILNDDFKNMRLISIGKALSLFIGFCFLVAAAAQLWAEETAQSAAECKMIQDKDKRLECYDRIVGLGPSGKRVSYFSQLWDLDEVSRRGKYAIKLHRSTWVLPFSYNSSPNIAVAREADPNKDLKKPEVVFQMSVKVKLLQDIFGRNTDLWFAYTQRSFWQLYNFSDSSPFRETNYEPELLLSFRTDYSVLGLKGRFINFGLNHQSNGQTEPLSRSWNRAVLNFGFEKEPFSFLLKTWCRFPESGDVDDNPGIEKYLGYGELWTHYFVKKHRFGLMIRNNLNFHTNRGAVQIEWGFPLIFERISGYVQYYAGYGESLMDYNHRVNRVGVGIILPDWN